MLLHLLTCPDKSHGTALPRPPVPGSASLTIFQCITMEGWVDIMNTGQNTLHPATWIFFVLLVFFGQFILINLVMARQATTPLSHLPSPVSVSTCTPPVPTLLAVSQNCLGRG